MAYGAAADDENVLAYGSKTVAMEQQAAAPLHPPSQQQQQPPAALAITSTSSHSVPPQEGMRATSAFSAERADLALDFLKATWADCRPWDEFYSTRAFSVPSFASLSDRVIANVNNFKPNYIIIAVVWLSVAVLSGIPTFLITGLLFFGLERWATRKANKNGGALTQRDRVVIGVIALIIVWLTGVVGYVIASLFFTGLSIGVHAVFHEEPVATEISAV